MPSGGMAGMNMTGFHMTGPMWMPSAPPTIGRLFAWHPQPIPVMPLLCLAAALLYGYGMLRLRRRGDRWPIGRLIAWLFGLLSILSVTSTGIAGYSMELFSAHMVQHMMLSMFAPIPLLMGAPVTLALRALPVSPRRGARGPREVLVAVIHSRFARVITSVFFTMPLFIASLYGLYFTPLFDFLMRTWAGHGVMMLHFLLVGLLFFYPIMGVDPAPTARKPVFAILELFGGMPFHAFFGIAVMMSTGLITRSFDHVPAGWHTTALSDQQAGGAIAWAFSEIPTIIVLLVVFAKWRKSEERLARRSDRAAERDRDAELNAYNAYLAELNTHGRVHVDEPAQAMVSSGHAPKRGHYDTSASEHPASSGDGRG
jgi:cytochrome c oxidase assembly factor CtaG